MESEHLILSQSILPDNELSCVCVCVWYWDVCVRVCTCVTVVVMVWVEKVPTRCGIAYR